MALTVHNTLLFFTTGSKISNAEKLIKNVFIQFLLWLKMFYSTTLSRKRLSVKAQLKVHRFINQLEVYLLMKYDVIPSNHNHFGLCCFACSWFAEVHLHCWYNTVNIRPIRKFMNQLVLSHIANSVNKIHSTLICPKAKCLNRWGIGWDPHAVLENDVLS